MRLKQDHLLAYLYCDLLAVTVICGFTLLRIPQSAFADANSTATATVTVASACTLTTTGGGTYSTTMLNGTSNDINANAISISCNDNSGFEVYAVGYANNTIGWNMLLYNGVGDRDYDISTGDENSYRSNWLMYVSGTNVNIKNDFNGARDVPNTYEVVANNYSNTSSASITPVYAIKVGSSQPAGTYVGKVKYTIVHPVGANAPTQTGIGLYDTIADMSKGTQTAADLAADITVANSGVYEYDSRVFGSASDASNDYPIYYYRGILDSNASSVDSSSEGDGVIWPNYVLLEGSTTRTCWRIVRTTGSGGIKMIYNGPYGGTTVGSCSNRLTRPFADEQQYAFNVDYTGQAEMMLSTYITSVGYTHKPMPRIVPPTNDTYSNIFGVAGSASSTIKGRVEHWWLGMHDGEFDSILETNAGYCNDRTLYTRSRTYDLVADGGTVSRPYLDATGSRYTEYYFGAYVRNYDIMSTPSLHCPRSLDLYTTAASASGNQKLVVPVALLTADEAAFAGSGFGTGLVGGNSSYSAQSFLTTQAEYWLLSPYTRSADGKAKGSVVDLAGASAKAKGVDYTDAYVRPVISLAPGTTAYMGTGTATDPWIVLAP